jgi:hypothetical protein
MDICSLRSGNARLLERSAVTHCAQRLLRASLPAAQHRQTVFTYRTKSCGGAVEVDACA